MLAWRLSHDRVRLELLHADGAAVLVFLRLALRVLNLSELLTDHKQPLLFLLGRLPLTRRLIKRTVSLDHLNIELPLLLAVPLGPCTRHHAE